MPSLLTPGGADARDIALDVAQEHRTPASEKLSAITFIVMVLPVPLAARDQAVAVAHIERKLPRARRPQVPM